MNKCSERQEYPMTIPRFSFGHRLYAPASLVFSIGFALALIHAPGCSSTGSTTDGSAEGGRGGAGGPGSGGTSGESGHSGTGGTAGPGSGGTAGGGATGGSGGVGGKGAGGTSGGGSGGVSGKGEGGTSGAGSDTCTVGQSFCYAFTPGTAGSTGRSCQATPPACESSPTSCACLCPPSSNPAIGCVPVGMSDGYFCSCGDANGVVNVSCAGS